MGDYIKIISLITVLLFLFLGCKEQQVEVKDVKPWIGKWNSVNYTDSTGNQYPWIGVFHYYEDGTFSNQGLTPARDTLASDPTTIEEYKALFDFYRAGYGTYSVDEMEGKLTYEYVSNLRTHRIGKPTEISFQVKGDSLMLKYEEMQVHILLIR